MMTVPQVQEQKLMIQNVFLRVRHDFYRLLPFSEIKRNTWYDFVFNINLTKTTLVRLITRFGK
ncbi:MAG: hypothetical protein CM15mP111_1420 [Hyphomicrobiales bacterium]|nr:MAG: hypothetical protein CM15mP111_1420 [Hyphomicrobiales bacterium]